MRIADDHQVVETIHAETAGRFSHEKIISNSTYSPWLDNLDFIEIYNKIRTNTLVDHLRCYELWTLVAQTATLEGDILEVGVWRGGTGCLIAHRAKALGLSSQVYLCDTFSGVVKAGDNDPLYKGGEHADAPLSMVLELACDLGNSNIKILAGVFPDHTAQFISDRQFSLCHIDVDVYDSARDIVNWVWPRLVIGGMIVYDDYGFPSCQGVTHLVNQFTPRKGCITIHNINGHAISVKVSPFTLSDGCYLE